MANKPIAMNKIKQILRLHFEGIGSKSTSAITGVSRNAVKQYIARFKALELGFEQLQELDDGQIYALFFPNLVKVGPSDAERYSQLAALLPEISRRLKKRGATVLRMWGWYREQHPDGYGKTQFYQYLRQYRRRSGLTMVMEHKVGDKPFVDFAGEKLRIVDTHSGELREMEVFVAILGCSQLTYVEACRSQQKEDFIACCRNALEYLGGAPQAIVPDNLKSAVTKSSKYEPILNESFSSFAEHYSTAILPARAFKPKDKSLVEGAVKLIYQRIYARLGDPVCVCTKELNALIGPLLEDHNNAPLKGGQSRRELFEQEERASLNPLPAIPYQLKRIKEYTVMKNGHVGLQEDRHYYSVPYELTGKKVRLIYDADQVAIYYQFKRVALHTRSYKKNSYSTQKEHLASQHQFIAEWSSEYFLSEGRAISEEVAQFIDGLLSSKAHPEQGYKACLGVLNLGKRFGHPRLIKACKRAIEYQAYTYYILQDILKKGLDQLGTESDTVLTHSSTPLHQNLRGGQYYQQSLTLKTNHDE